jgi:hypothetical protein
MTRKQVALRLGKSVSTVRRLEGHSLFPEVDENGCHQFDPDEVEALAYRLAQGEPLDAAANPWRPDPGKEIEDLREENDRLRRENDELRLRNLDLDSQVHRMKRESDQAARTMLETSRLLGELYPGL